jgi:hypothetical protein
VVEVERAVAAARAGCWIVPSVLAAGVVADDIERLARELTT